MSVTFSVATIRYNLEDPTSYLNVSNVNAADLLRHLGLPTAELWGDIRARTLVGLCDRALAASTSDAAIEAYEENSSAGQLMLGGRPPMLGQARLIFGGRPAGYLRERTTQLRALALSAGDLGRITWD